MGTKGANRRRWVAGAALLLAGCGDSMCQRPIAEATAELPATWDDVVGSSRCVRTQAGEDGERELFLDQCETVAGALYGADGALKAAFATDDTGRCVVHYGPGSFLTSGGMPSPGCVTRIYASDPPATHTPSPGGTFVPQGGCYGQGICAVDGVDYRVFARIEACETHRITVTDLEGNVVADGFSYLSSDWQGPAALHACMETEFTASPGCGFAD